MADHAPLRVFMRMLADLEYTPGADALTKGIYTSQGRAAIKAFQHDVINTPDVFDPSEFWPGPDSDKTRIDGLIGSNTAKCLIYGWKLHRNAKAEPYDTITVPPGSTEVQVPDVQGTDPVVEIPAATSDDPTDYSALEPSYAAGDSVDAAEMPPPSQDVAPAEPSPVWGLVLAAVAMLGQYGAAWLAKKLGITTGQAQGQIDTAKKLGYVPPHEDGVSPWVIVGGAAVVGVAAYLIAKKDKRAA